jgi:regulatory protein
VTDLERCYAAALRILRYRFNSAGELRRKLTAKEFDRDTIAETIARLTNEKWIDDARFAGAYVRTRLLKRIGKLRIRRELMVAGVADDIISDAIRANVNTDEERERAVAAARRRIPILQKKGELRNKLTAYLLKQGYDGALVRDVVKELLSETLIAHE